jgi:hypothetical protein
MDNDDVDGDDSDNVKLKNGKACDDNGDNYDNRMIMIMMT